MGSLPIAERTATKRGLRKEATGRKNPASIELIGPQAALREVLNPQKIISGAKPGFLRTPVFTKKGLW